MFLCCSGHILIFSITTATVHLSQSVIQVFVEINCNVMNVLQMGEPKLMRKQTGFWSLHHFEDEFYLAENKHVLHQKLDHIELFFILPETEYPTKSGMNWWFWMLAAHWNRLGNLAPAWWDLISLDWTRHWEWFSCAAKRTIGWNNEVTYCFTYPQFWWWHCTHGSGTQ